MSNQSNNNTPGRYADILLDDWFKRSFKEYGDAKRLMLLFLQALIPEMDIQSIEYTPEESTNQNPDKKGIRVDVECIDKNGDRFVVEVQRADQTDFYDRAVFNSTFSIQRQLKENPGTYRFRPVCFIGIMRFTLHPTSDKFFYHYQLKECETGETMTDDLHYYYLEVTKCSPNPEGSLVEKVGYALNHMSEFKERPAGFDGEFFDLLFNSAEINNFAPEEKIKYHNDMTTERDIKNQIAYAEQKGLEKGFEQGVVQTLESTAKNMLALGLSDDVVVKATGLSGERIAQLKEDNK